MSNTTRKAAAKKSPAPTVLHSDENFVYTSEAGVRIEMPSLAGAVVTVEMMDDLAEAMDTENEDGIKAFRAQRRFMRALINDEETNDKLKKLSLEEFQALVLAWGSRSGVTVGESSPS